MGKKNDEETREEARIEEERRGSDGEQIGDCVEGPSRCLIGAESSLLARRRLSHSNIRAKGGVAAAG